MPALLSEALFVEVAYAEERGTVLLNYFLLVKPLERKWHFVRRSIGKQDEFVEVRFHFSFEKSDKCRRFLARVLVFLAIRSRDSISFERRVLFGMVHSDDCHRDGVRVMSLERRGLVIDVADTLVLLLSERGIENLRLGPNFEGCDWPANDDEPWNHVYRCVRDQFAEGAVSSSSALSNDSVTCVDREAVILNSFDVAF